MPIPIPVIQAGAEQLSQGINAVLQGFQNRRDRRFAQQQYNIQRQDALSDWNMQNEYNSPASQMERLKAAGLNPNLVYGSGVNQVSAQVKSATAATPQGTAPKFSGSNVVGAYLDAQMRQAQTDNLKVQNTVLMEEAKLKAAQTVATLAGTSLKEFDFDFKTQNRNVMLADAHYRLRKLFNEANLMGEKVTTEQQTRQPNIDSTKAGTALKGQQVQESRQRISESMQRVLLMIVQEARTQAEVEQITQRIENMKRTGELQDLEIKLKRVGATWNDKYWIRKLEMLIQNL